MLNAFGLFSFKSLFGKSSAHGSYYSTRACYSKLYVPASVSVLDSLLSTNDREVRETEKEILFKKLPFGISLKAATKGLKEFYQIDNSDVIANYKVCVRRTKIGGLHVVAQFHFLNNKLFMGQYLLNKLTEQELIFLKSILAQKYLNGEEVNLSESIIRDQKGNKIKMTSDNFGSVIYITGDDNIITQLQELNEEHHSLLFNRQLSNQHKLYDLL